jgi:hypothetical protein
MYHIRQYHLKGTISFKCNYFNQNTNCFFCFNAPITYEKEAYEFQALAEVIINRFYNGELQQGSYYWVPCGRGDCGRHNMQCSAGNMPDDQYCSAGALRHVNAICWNGGVNLSTPGNLTCPDPRFDWCTYKTDEPDSCIGGAHPGMRYQCVRMQ